MIRSKPKTYKLVYYKCNHCFYVGVLASCTYYGYCGFKWCGKLMYFNRVEITKEAYEKVWK